MAHLVLKNLYNKEGKETQSLASRLEATRVRRLKRLVFDRLNRSLRGLENFKSAEDRRPDRGYGLCRS